MSYPNPPGSSSTLESLTDVSVDSPSNGQSLVFENGLWVNATGAVSGVSGFGPVGELRTGDVHPQAGDYDNIKVGLGNVPNVDATNADNITSGTFDPDRYAVNSINNQKLSKIAPYSFKGNPTSLTEDVTDFNTDVATSILKVFLPDSGSGGAQGLVPAPSIGDANSGKYLNVDGGFSIPTPSGIGAQAIITNPIANDLVTVNSSGQVIDSGLSLTTISSTNTDTQILSSKATQTAIIDNSLSKTLDSGHLLIGNDSDVASSVVISGDANINNIGVLTISNNSISNAKLAQVAGLTLKGNVNSSIDNVSDVTGVQAVTILPSFVGDSGSGGQKGLVPAPQSGDSSANKFLNANGQWALIPSSPIGVSSFNTRIGDVLPTSGDYDKTMIGLGNVPNVDATNASNISSGTLSSTRMPALTGVVTTTAGSTSTSFTPNSVSNSILTQMPANTIKGNNTGSTADPINISTNTAFNANFETNPVNIKTNGAVSVGSLSTIARADHVHGSDPTKQPLSGNLTSLSNLSTTAGFIAKLAQSSHIQRTLTGTINQINITNGDGTIANPVFSLPQDIALTSSPTFASETLTNSVPDQNTIGGTGTSLSAITNIWQSWTAGVSGNLSRIDFFFASLPASNYNITIFSGSGTGGTNLYSFGISLAGVTSNFAQLILPISLNITSGAQYTVLVVQNPASSNANVQYSTSNPYSGGQSNLGPTIDYQIITYVNQSIILNPSNTIPIVSNSGIQATGGALIPPSLTTTQRDALNSAYLVNGAMIYNSTKGYREFYNAIASAWYPVNTYALFAGLNNPDGNATTQIPWGCTNNSTAGLTMPIGGAIIASSICVVTQSTGGTLMARMSINGNIPVNGAVISSGSSSAYLILPTPITYNAGDNITLYSAGSAFTPAPNVTVGIWVADGL